MAHWNQCQSNECEGDCEGRLSRQGTAFGGRAPTVLEGAREGSVRARFRDRFSCHSDDGDESRVAACLIDFEFRRSAHREVCDAAGDDAVEGRSRVRPIDSIVNDEKVEGVSSIR